MLCQYEQSDGHQTFLNVITQVKSEENLVTRITRLATRSNLARNVETVEFIDMLTLMD